MIKKYYPYLIALMIGILMIPFFVIGWYLETFFDTIWSTLFMQIGLLIWPFYIMIVFSLSLIMSFKKHQHNINHRITQFRRASLVIPLGALVGVALVLLVFRLSGGNPWLT